MVYISTFRFAEGAEAGVLSPEEMQFLRIDAAASGKNDSGDLAFVNARLDELETCETFALRDEASRRLIGTMALYERNDGVLWLDALAITQPQRSCGIGGSALKWVESIAIKRGCTSVEGHALANPRTLGFYTDNGYERIRSVGNDYALISKRVDGA